jgi:hypothetical protein
MDVPFRPRRVEAYTRSAHDFQRKHQYRER